MGSPANGIRSRSNVKQPRRWYVRGYLWLLVFVLVILASNFVGLFASSIMVLIAMWGIFITLKRLHEYGWWA